MNTTAFLTHAGHRDCRQDEWLKQAVSWLQAESRDAGETAMLEIPLGKSRLWLKDESAHASGSLKHRLARSLILHALCNGWVRQDTPLVEASSGSTAVSEAWFARRLGLEFHAVMPVATANSKIAAIEAEGGICHFVENPAHIGAEATALAARLGGHFLDQFRNAERATDWRGNNNVAQAIFDALPDDVPDWIVCGAGTGGTSATIGRYIRYCGFETRLLVVDPEHSAFHRYYASGDCRAEAGGVSLIEGIGRPGVEASFVPQVIDAMLPVPDAASIAAAHWLSERLGRAVGGSTGSNFWGVCQLALAGKGSRFVSLLCDSGERYRETLFDDAWLRERGIRLDPWLQTLNALA